LYYRERLAQERVEALQNGGAVVVAASAGLASLQQPPLHLLFPALQKHYEPGPPDLALIT